MPTLPSALEALASLPLLELKEQAPLSQYTRFGIGGPALALGDTADESTFLEALTIARESGVPLAVLGAGTNLIVSDHGFDGIVLRYVAQKIRSAGNRITVDAGAVLQQLVDFSVAHALDGLHTMTGIPGWVGAAVYGNAGAYGHSISEFVRLVRFYDGDRVATLDNAGCEFAYRESVFKRHKEWIILSAELELPAGDREALATKAPDILQVRNAKYPPTMKCAGSIFKNLLFRALPESVQAEVPVHVVREGKVPSAWFLEQVGAKGIRLGGIEVAPYHANLIYNIGPGTASELLAVILDLKQRVHDRFGFFLEEEVQYVGFSTA
jgi:UDP-N-acetylmuramate dehydrogenase